MPALPGMFVCAEHDSRPTAGEAMARLDLVPVKLKRTERLATVIAVSRDLKSGAYTAELSITGAKAVLFLDVPRTDENEVQRFIDCVLSGAPVVVALEFPE